MKILTRLASSIKAALDRRRGPRYLEISRRPRCLALGCGEVLTEEEAVLGSRFCGNCNPRILRRAQGAPPIFRPIKRGSR